MKVFYKKSIWVMLTIYLSLWLAATLVAGVILDGYKKTINATLGLTGYRTETITTEGEDLEYFKSDYVQKDANGNVLYTTDENGYRHQVYDDAALKRVALQKARQVQREGTTILWNSATNGLPLAKGNKVSLFSHSSVDWVYGGQCSGRPRVVGASNMKTALTNAGLTVNNTLWNFYASGAGSSYKRTHKYTMNEVPWSKYTDDVKNSFATYGDAAIIVFSRQDGEGYASDPSDCTTILADTPSGDYFDLSIQESKMLEEVIAAKRAGKFKKVIVLLNTPTDMWLDPLLDLKGDIDTCMWVGQTGFNGLDEVGSILVGDSIPSGHLVNTFLQNTRSTPAYVNSLVSFYTNAYSMKFQDVKRQGAYMNYAEGIYVGYKYFETRYEDAVLGNGNATSTAGSVNSASNWKYSEEVAFPFGYGASYTTFEYSNYNVTKNADGNYEVTLTVKNTGTQKGADAVQVYIQKPYTEYDKQNGIEQAAVNLVGYAKTAELEPNATENVTITVRDDAFKTYDANGQKTYIREKGTYYLTAAQDAHDAVNNVLAAKGKTPANTNNVMDAAGNAALVKNYDFTTDDFETFATSEITGNAITNQFDDVDWNKYENKTEATITYLSRKDWAATYPTAVTAFSLNDAMVEDLAYDHEHAAKPEDEMPLYEQEHVFNLMDLKGYEYDHTAWETLLDQLSLEEQINLLGTAYHGTAEIIGIAKPAENVNDGPMGVREKYLNSNDYTLSYPSNTVLAATYNDKLALEVGTLKGEDLLHAGFTGIYGPGSNIHRTTYSCRNVEYYSEDGFISGIMGKQETIGIQSKGCYVVMKHFALNDQEGQRHGINTWANEQSIREVYLPAFEYAVSEGGAKSIMTAFNRLGTKWSGAHKGLQTNVLRGEWGFDGFVVSDSRWIAYMGVIDGLMAGNDCILDTVDLKMWDSAKTNATIAQAVRQATHRILYVVANSNAMNGFSSNTRIYEVKEWWQQLVSGVQIGVGAVTGVLFVITVLCFVLHKKIAAIVEPKEKARAERKEQERLAKMQSFDGDDNGNGGGFGGTVKDFFCIGQPWHAKRIIITVVSIVLALAIVFTSIFVPVALLNKPQDPPPATGGEGGTEGGGNEGGGEDTPEPSLKDQLTGDLKDYKFEAEMATVVQTGTPYTGQYTGLEGKTIQATNYPSGDAFLYRLNRMKQCTITFNVTASEATQAVLSLCMGAREMSILLSNLFTIDVNGTRVSYNSELAFPVHDSVQYYDWTELEVAIVNLQQGNNVITFTNVAPTDTLNFDYMSLTSATNIQDPRCASAHTYGAYKVVTEPSEESAGKAICYCQYCATPKEVVLPAISEANGYTKTVNTPNSATTFGSATWSYTVEGQTLTFNRILYPTAPVQSYKFEAEKGILGGSANKAVDTLYSASGGAYVGKFDKYTSSITLNINANVACEAMFIINFGCRSTVDIKMNDGKTLTVNGTAVSISDDVVFPKVESENDWFNWKEFEVVVVNLQAGKNVITLSNAKKQFGNIDYFKLVSTAELSWWVEE